MNQALRKSFDSFFNNKDKFLKSLSEYNPEIPLEITNVNEKIVIKSAFRDGYMFTVKCKIHSTNSEKSRNSTLKFSSKHCSYIKLVERFGLSQRAKELYRGLDIYDTHFSGQANLTSLRWQHSVEENLITATSDFGKDLIFKGESIQGSPTMQEHNIKIYRSHRKANEFVVTYQLETECLSTEKQNFKIIDSENLVLDFNNKTELIKFLESLESFWECKHVY